MWYNICNHTNKSVERQEEIVYLGLRRLEEKKKALFISGLLSLFFLPSSQCLKGTVKKIHTLSLWNRICKLYQEEKLAIMRYPEPNTLLNGRLKVMMMHKCKLQARVERFIEHVFFFSLSLSPLTNSQCRYMTKILPHCLETPKVVKSQ